MMPERERIADVQRQLTWLGELVGGAADSVPKGDCGGIDWRHVDKAAEYLRAAKLELAEAVAEHVRVPSRAETSS